jgi:cellobiose phosphorylase
MDAACGPYSDDGSEYIITSSNTSMPWVNVISNGDYGLVISQAGSGYSWRTHAGLNRINRWEQDLIRDRWGKFLYGRDRDTGEFWSATYQPIGSGLQEYRVRHGILQDYFTQGAVKNVLEPILEMEQFMARD